jgi:hypothetical protein
VPADQISAIAPFVREAIAGGPGWCATFEVSGEPSQWVQFKGGVINAAYPHSASPEFFIRKLGAFQLQEVQLGQFLMGELLCEDARLVAAWIDSYFTFVLACAPDYPVDASIERM